MAFKDINDLDTDVTIALGGINKKTGKPNPTKIEGYYLGSKQVASPKNKTGKAFLYTLQTQKGNVGVWGKTDLDRKMAQVTPGTMIRIVQDGMKATSNGDMYKYKVSVDADNVLEGYVAPTSAPTEQSDDSAGALFTADDFTSNDFSDDEEVLDEPTLQQPKAPRTVTSAAEQKAKAEALLAKMQNRKS